MCAEATVRDYYEALRRGDPLYPYFLEHPDVVKVGVSERLVGYDDVAEGLREQTRSTEDWRVESTALSVVERDDHACFADAVSLQWRDTDTGRDVSFETRWSGTLERRPADGDAEWLFTGMHVSAPVEAR